MFIIDTNLSLYVAGHCYCKQKFGGPGENDIMCKIGRKFEQHNICQEQEMCVGPVTLDAAESFSRRKFCATGTST